MPFLNNNNNYFCRFYYYHISLNGDFEVHTEILFLKNCYIILDICMKSFKLLLLERKMQYVWVL